MKFTKENTLKLKGIRRNNRYFQGKTFSSKRKSRAMY